MKFLLIFLIPAIPAIAMAVLFNDNVGTKELVGGTYFVMGLPYLIWFLVTEMHGTGTK